METKKLFILSNDLGSFYVIATSFDEAVEKLMDRLHKADYGYYSAREVKSISIIAEEEILPNGNQSFSSDTSNLIS